MTSLFKKALDHKGVTIKEFAILSDTPVRTVYGWANGTRRVPGIALRFLVALKLIEILNKDEDK